MTVRKLFMPDGLSIKAAAWSYLGASLTVPAVGVLVYLVNYTVSFHSTVAGTLLLGIVWIGCQLLGYASAMASRGDLTWQIREFLGMSNTMFAWMPMMGVFLGVALYAGWRAVK
jgi:hypothetical protein